MTGKNQYLFLLLIICFAFASCQRSIDIDQSAGSAYFPLKIGNYVIYEIELEEYSIIEPVSFTQQQLKEVVADTFTNQMGEIVYVIERYIRNTQEAEWEFDEAWAAIKTPQLAILYESNVPFIKISFPTKQNNTWDGNALNDQLEENYTLINYKSALNINDLVLDNTITIDQLDDSSLVTRKKKLEIFAENIGLVYKERIDLRYKDDPENLGQGIISFGTIYKQRITDYGIEE